MAPKNKPSVTSSATRSKRQAASKAKVSGATPSSRTNRQKLSNASTTKMTTSRADFVNPKNTSAYKKVTEGRGGKGPAGLLKAGKPASPGLIGTRNPISAETKARMASAAPKPTFKTRPTGPSSKLPPKGPPMRTGAKGPAAATLKSVGSQALKGAARAGLKGAGRAAIVGTAAAKILDAGATGRNEPKLAKAAMSKEQARRTKNRALQNKATAVVKKKAAAANFDKAFASARSSGKSAFTWKGKKYTTKVK